MTQAGDVRVVCPPELQGYPLGDGRGVIHRRGSTATVVLDGNAYQALTSCSHLATINNHSERLANHGYAPLAEVRRRMTRWLQAGLLIDADALVAELKAPQETPPRPAMGALCIPTMERQGVLHRALTTLSPAGCVLIGDDSPTEAARLSTRALIDAVRGQLPDQLVLIDRPRRARMAEQLARHTGVDLKLLRYALQPESGPLRSYGANRNALLLAMAGRAFVFADDDTFGPLHVPETHTTGLRISADAARLQCSFPEPGTTRFEGTRATATPLLTAHAALLGAPASELLRQPGVNLEGTSGALLKRLAEPGARVIVTQLGAMGDSGTGSLGHYMLLAGRSRERLLQSEEHYGWAHESRQVRVWVESPLVTDAARCMGMACGIDASVLVPPFAPLQRNADGVFGLLVSRCFAGALFGWLPSMVQHAPPAPRRSSFEQTLQEMRGIDSNDALSRLIASASSPDIGPDPGSNMRRLGATLCDWVSEPLLLLEARLRALAVRTRAGDVQQLHRTLQQHDFEPSYWAQDVRRAIMALEEGLLDPQHAWPRDLMAALGPQPGRLALRDHVRQFGELLSAWPTVFEAAQQLWPEPAAL